MPLQRVCGIVFSAVLIALAGSCDGRLDPSESIPPSQQTEAFRILNHDLNGVSGGVLAGVFSSDGKWALTGGWEWGGEGVGSVGAVWLWNVETGKVIRKYGDSTHGDCTHQNERLHVVRRVAFSHNGRLVLAGGGDVRAWYVDTGDEAWRFDGHELGILGMRISPDGTRILTASRDGSAKLLDARTGRELLSLDGHRNLDSWPYCWDAVFSPDGRRILTAGQDRTARLWDAETGQELRRFDHDGEVRECAFLPDGIHILTSNGVTARLWDVESGGEVTDRAWLNAFRVLSPDGRHALGTQVEEDEYGYRWTATSWDIGTDRKVSEFDFYHCTGITFSGSGNHILTFNSSRYAEDYSLKLWDVATGEEISKFEGHNWQVLCAALSPDGQHVLSFEKDSGIAIIWASPEQ